jgi:NAD-dependent histone deacetylase SIR2
VLYGEEHPSAESIGSLTAADLRAAPDMLIIMGTSLKVHGLKRMVREFSKAVHAKGGSVIFVNNTPPPESVWKDVIDYHVSMSCDAWVEDIKLRRAGIWDRQTVLPLQKVIKNAISPLSKHKARLQKENTSPGTPRKAKSAPSTPSGRKRAPLGATSGNAYLPTPSSTKRSQKTPASRRRKPLRETDVEDTPSKRRKLSSTTGLSTPPLTPSCQRLVAVEITSPRKSQIFEGSPRKQLLRELEEDLSELSDLTDLDLTDDEILIATPRSPKKVSKI